MRKGLSTAAMFLAASVAIGALFVVFVGSVADCALFSRCSNAYAQSLDQSTRWSLGNFAENAKYAGSPLPVAIQVKEGALVGFSHYEESAKSEGRELKRPERCKTDACICVCKDSGCIDCQNLEDVEKIIAKRYSGSNFEGNKGDSYDAGSYLVFESSKLAVLEFEIRDQNLYVGRAGKTS